MSGKEKHAPISGTITEGMEAGCRMGLTIDLDDLTAGTYEVIATVTAEEEEAYLSNNTLRYTFYVSSRLRTEDDLSFSAEAIYDGSLPFDSIYGSNGCGRLDLTYSGDLDYSVKQYSVSAEYLSEDGDSLDSETLYFGAERPTTVYGLKPLGSKASISVYAIPEDPAVGYERLIGAQEVELSYFFIKMSAEKQSFNPIHDTDTAFQNGDQLELTLHQSATKQNYDVRVQVIAEEVDSAVSKMIYDRWIQTDEFDSNGDLTWIITDFYVVSSRASSKLETLDDGTYRLWAEVKYSINESNNYQYMDYLNVGELTVLPSVPELTDVSHTVISATQTAIHYKVNSSECESLVVKVFYGTDAGDLTIMAGASYEDYPGGAHEDEILLELLPETTYYYRVELIVNNGEPIEYSDESMNFTTPAATQEGPEPEEPIVFALLAPGEQNTVMEAGQQAYYETAAPNEDGVWSFTFAGADGYVCVWDDEQSDWGERIGFGIEDQSIVLPLAVKQGQPVRLLVFAYVADDYQISYAQNEIVNYQNEKGIFVNAVEGEYTFVASYASTGRMLSARRVETAGCQFVSVDPAADVVRVFRLDHEYAPVGGASANTHVR